MPRLARRTAVTRLLVAVFPLVSSAPALADFAAFESGPVRPLALSADGNTLYAVNTPGNQLELFAVDPSGGLSRTGAVPVGLEPVAVAVRNAGEVWVVNHLSDSVSIVDVAAVPPRVRRTLLVGDEPRDIVFGGAAFDRAFVTTARRGQNIPFNPRLTGDGHGRAVVYVFDANNLGSSLEGDPIATLFHFADTPRALAVSPDGATVYAAAFHSGNQTTAISEGLVCDGGAASMGCVINGTPVPGGLPAPNANFEGIPGPEVGLIVKFNPATSQWEDELGRNWNDVVRFDLPDRDVFAIDANATPPVESGWFSGVGTILFNMVVHPSNGKVYVSNTEARNEVRFEGPGITGTTVRGRLHEARITVLDGANVLPRHLNKHINYAVANPSAGVRAASLATPLEMAITADGSTLYVAAFGSNEVGVFQTAELDADSFTPSAASHIAVPGGLPGGLVLHEGRNRLYVLSRLDNAVSAIDLTTRAEVQHAALLNPEPFSIADGRRFLYDAQLTSGNGEASCSSCHVFGDLDDLAWDLGNPDESVLANLNPFRLGPIGDADFHPMKGPMTTQTLRGMDTHGPMHWRGDRSGANDPGGSAFDEHAAFMRFNPAFEGLIGRKTELAEADMEAFTDFILQVMPPPNPIRNLDNSLTPDQQAGSDFYFGPISDGVFNCNGCHVLDPGAGFFGTDGRSTFEGETQHFKIAHLRNAYTKIGMYGMASVPGISGGGTNAHRGEQIRGFGVLHDGSIDTVFRFLSASLFAFPDNTARRQMEDFVFAFDSNFAPIVGQQTTLTDTNAATVDPRVDRLIQRAAAGECDVVVKGTVADEARGAVRLPSGQFQTDRATDPLLSEAALRALATTPGQDLTFTAVPPGSGARIGIDRDGDGALDADELDAGTDPNSDLSLPPSALTCASAVVADRPVLRISRNDGAAGDERLSLRGEILLAPGSLDPRATGFRFKVVDESGIPLFQRAVRRGDPPAKNAPGWTVNKKRTRWVYKDRFAAAGDVFKIVVIDKSNRQPGLYRFVVTGKDGDFQVPTAGLPLSVVVVPGGPEEGAAGLCGGRVFNDEDGAKPRCRASASGATVTCS